MFVNKSITNLIPSSLESPPSFLSSLASRVVPLHGDTFLTGSLNFTGVVYVNALLFRGESILVFICTYLVVSTPSPAVRSKPFSFFLLQTRLTGCLPPSSETDGSYEPATKTS